jgi:hypothetical protein
LPSPRYRGSSLNVLVPLPPHAPTTSAKAQTLVDFSYRRTSFGPEIIAF